MLILILSWFPAYSRPTWLAGCAPKTISLITTASYLSVKLGLNDIRFQVPVHYILYFQLTTVDSVSSCRTQVQQNTRRQYGSSLTAAQAGAVVHPLAWSMYKFRWAVKLNKNQNKNQCYMFNILYILRILEKSLQMFFVALLDQLKKWWMLNLAL